MINNSSHRKLRDTLVLTLTVWLAPVGIILWAPVRLVASIDGWTRRILVLSLAGNALFVSVLILGYYESARSSSEGGLLLDRQVAPRCFEYLGDQFQFCRGAPGSEFERIVPNAIYVASDGIIRARFEFSNASLSSLSEVTLSDAVGRPWIDANLDDGKVVYSRYSSENGGDPESSLLDEDGDGIPDVKIDWIVHKRFRRDGELLWSLTDSKEKEHHDRPRPPHASQ